MKNGKGLVCIFITLTSWICADEMQMGSGAKNQPVVMDCSNFAEEMQAFSLTLSPENRQLFCGGFNDDQRMQAVRMTTQPDTTGVVMTSDQAVKKVAATNQIPTEPKTPGGCPLK